MNCLKKLVHCVPSKMQWTHFHKMCFNMNVKTSTLNWNIGITVHHSRRHRLRRCRIATEKKIMKIALILSISLEKCCWTFTFSGIIQFPSRVANTLRIRENLNNPNQPATTERPNERQREYCIVSRRCRSGRGGREPVGQVVHAGCLEQMMTWKLDLLWMQASLTLTEWVEYPYPYTSNMGLRVSRAS